MIELFPLIIAAIGSSISGYIDLRTTEIPDWVINSMVSVGFVYFLMQSIVAGNFGILANSIVAGLSGFIFGIILYFTGQWGGGDAKLLGAILFLVPSVPSAFSPTTVLPFPLTLTINTFLIGSVYIIVYALALSISKAKIRKEFYKSLKSREFAVMSAVSIALIIAMWAYFSILFGSTAGIILMMIPGVISLLALVRLLKTIEKKGFIERIKTSKLSEGDMIAENIRSLKIDKRIIRGLTKSEVSRIRKMKKSVLIRDGVRFGPVFLMALAASLFYGDLILLIF